MSDQAEVQFNLPVAGARNQDVGKGVARMTSEVFQHLGIQEGDIFEIVGKRQTPAVALAPYPEDEGMRMIRLDGLQRANANVSIGDSVEVRKPEVKPAKKITVAPAQKNVQLSGPGQALLRTLNRHLKKHGYLLQKKWKKNTGRWRSA
ncbi:MAG: hypothetical protein ACLFR1_08580 [Spirochaetia bacterium]